MKTNYFLKNLEHETIISTKYTTKKKSGSCTVILFLTKKNINTQNLFLINNSSIEIFLKQNIKMFKIFTIILSTLLCNNFNFAIFAYVSGGGSVTQVNLVNYTIYKILKKLKLTSINIKKDWRVKERKKVGKKKARKSSQYHKR